MSLAGFLNVVKPPGMTSHDVVGLIRRKVGRKTKVGHLGTLDPAAAGVLPLAVGRATKLIPTLPNLGDQMKGYLGQIQLGVTTTTDDLEGDVLTRGEFGEVTRERLSASLESFRGVISQVPPQVSALRKDGKRAYELVRAGERVELEARQVQIGELALRDYLPAEGRFTVYVCCGSGTYIRSMARDIGEQLGTGGALAFLLRTHSGPFRLEQAVSLEEILSDGVETHLLDCDYPFSPSAEEQVTV
jgi:tRNA pseudouridine55 synthase